MLQILSQNDLAFLNFLIEQRSQALDDGNNTYGLWGENEEDENALLDDLYGKLNAPSPGWTIQTDETWHYSYTRILDDDMDTVEVVRVTYGKHKGDPAEYLHTIVCLSEYDLDRDIRKVLEDFGADPLLDPAGHYDDMSDMCSKLNAAYKARREEIANLIGETMTGREMPPLLADAKANTLIGRS